MVKIIKIICLLCIATSLYGYDSDDSYGKKNYLLSLKDHNLLEVRGSYFFFVLQDPRDIYGTSMFSIELEDNHWFWDRTSIWGNFNFTWDTNGSSVALNTPTQAYISTLSVGGKYFFSMKKDIALYYLGAGFSGAVAYTHDSTVYIPKDSIALSPGLVGKSGILFKPSSHFVIDVFFDYYFQPILKNAKATFSQSYSDIGGFRTGVGLGYMF